MTVTLPMPGAVRSSGVLRGAAIEIEMLYRISEPGSDPSLSRYAYALLDRNGVELLAWHFHPDSSLSRVMTPYLHVSSSLRVTGPAGERGVIPLDKRHLPTGSVALAAFVGMLIEEFGVEPLARDWEQGNRI